MKGRRDILAILASLSGIGGLWYAAADYYRGRAAPKTSDELRARVVAAARAELGRADLDKYFADAAPQYVGEHPEWCGIFALWAIRQAGLAPDVQWMVARGFVFRLPETDLPRPGDIAYFATNQHHAIVAAVRGDMVDLVNGNGAGGVVSASTAPVAQARAYYSIQPWVDEAAR